MGCHQSNKVHWNCWCWTTLQWTLPCQGTLGCLMQSTSRQNFPPTPSSLNCALSLWHMICTGRTFASTRLVASLMAALYLPSSSVLSRFASSLAQLAWLEDLREDLCEDDAEVAVVPVVLLDDSFFMVTSEMVLDRTLASSFNISTTVPIFFASSLSYVPVFLAALTRENRVECGIVPCSPHAPRAWFTKRSLTSTSCRQLRWYCEKLS